jgi:uncharacterized membrane protein YphA (DoxX/SURF4 family)
MNKNRRHKWGRILLAVARLALAVIFLVSGYTKVKPQSAMPWSARSVRTSLSMFAMQVDSYEMLPPRAVITVAHVLPFFELCLGLWLVSGVGLRFSSMLSVLAFLAFMAAIAWAYHKGLKIKCGCGIGPDEEVGPGALIRDGLKFLPLALAVAFGSFWIHRDPSLRHGCGSRSELSEE